MSIHYKILRPANIVGIVYLLIMFSAGCTNPLNQATYYRYTDQGDVAIINGNWGGAEVAYQRALSNVYMGNLSPKEESNALYNVGRVKQVLGKYDEAAQCLEQALVIDEKLNAADGHHVGYVLGELAITYFKQGKLDEGIELLDKLEVNYLKSPEGFTLGYKGALKRIFNVYAKELYKLGREAEAKQLESFAISIIIPNE